MKLKNKTNSDELLRRIARFLMLHGSFCNNIGLLNGKTGITLFFYHYARYTGNRIYNDFAGELIDEIYKDIHLGTPQNFKDGLSGIAWGMEYFIRNGFVAADPDEILEDLDQQILERDVRRVSDDSLETGLKGLACYTINRMANREQRRTVISKEYIANLISALSETSNQKEAEELMLNNLKNILSGEKTGCLYNPIINLVRGSRFNPEAAFKAPISFGITNNGLAGMGLQLMRITD